jgi:tetraacyldisaccharide 4'-kinase
MRALSAVLEQGRLRGPLARLCASGWARLAERTVVRPLQIPPHARVVTVGGATIGGSGKTPLAIACAAHLASAGARVALVGHAYRAKPTRPRVVAVDDPLHEVGDEAILAATTLASTGAIVVVAPTRSESIALAASRADVIVVDGVAQTSPARASLALLAVDAARPWGSGAVPPCGDLRAPEEVLRRACDAIVAVGDASDFVERTSAELALSPAPSDCTALVVSSGAWLGGTLWSWADLTGIRLGLLYALARPDRVVRWLALRGITLRAVVGCRDHGPVDAGFGARVVRESVRRGVDMWLATPKCALHFGDRAPSSGRPRAQLAASSSSGEIAHRIPLATIEHALALGGELGRRLSALALP